MSGRRFSESDGDSAMRAAGLNCWVQHTHNDPPKDPSPQRDPPVFESQNHKLYELLHDGPDDVEDTGSISDLARRPSLIDNFKEHEEEKLVLT